MANLGKEGKAKGRGLTRASQSNCHICHLFGFAPKSKIGIPQPKTLSSPPHRPHSPRSLQSRSLRSLTSTRDHAVLSRLTRTSPSTVHALPWVNRYVFPSYPSHPTLWIIMIPDLVRIFLFRHSYCCTHARTHAHCPLLF